jgi:hypothetical protein
VAVVDKSASKSPSLDMFIKALTSVLKWRMEVKKGKIEPEDVEIEVKKRRI